MGYVRCAREVVAGMQARGWGRIVNISGLAARQTGNAVGSMRNVAVGDGLPSGVTNSNIGLKVSSMPSS